MPERQQAQRSTESKSTAQKQATPRIQAPISHPMAIIQRARINPKSLTHADVMQLQSTIGNRAVVRLLSEIGLIPSKTKQAPAVQRQEPVQRQEIPEEEEPLQGKFESGPEKETCPSCMQRQEIPEEEEPLQGKIIGTIQRQEIPEEEEPLQGKFENKPEIACPSCFTASIVQRQEIPEEEEPLQGKFESIQHKEIPEEEEPLQTKRENNTGMPDNLKAGVENLSGIDMSDVRVHYNSSKPADVGALAYTQGKNIHVAPGQERYLHHEAWHVVQQAQGRVKPTMQLKNIAVNDDAGLEREADVMGEKALLMKRVINENSEEALHKSRSNQEFQSTLAIGETIQRTENNARLYAPSNGFSPWTQRFLDKHVLLDNKNVDIEAFSRVRNFSLRDGELLTLIKINWNDAQAEIADYLTNIPDDSTSQLTFNTRRENDSLSFTTRNQYMTYRFLVNNGTATRVTGFFGKNLQLNLGLVLESRYRKLQIGHPIL